MQKNNMMYLRGAGTDAAYHFSMEEFFMDHLHLTKPVFMIWQAEKCAMLGLNQVAHAEIDLEVARKENIQIVRRQSGGGTIFTDMGTLLFTLILPDAGSLSPNEVISELFAGPIVRAINSLGIPAVMEGRNDLLVDGRKFSGMAQFSRKGRICSHGSLLVDTDLGMLTKVLSVDPDKILSKAIRSVRSRVTNLSEHMENPVSATDFWDILEKKLAQEWELEPFVPTNSQLSTIDEIYNKKFGNSEWTFSKSPAFSLHSFKRFPGGKVEIFLDVVNGKIAACSICGDFLSTQPINDLEKRLENTALSKMAVASVLEGFDISPYLGTITEDEFLACMFGEMS